MASCVLEIPLVRINVLINVCLYELIQKKTDPNSRQKSFNPLSVESN